MYACINVCLYGLWLRFKVQDKELKGATRITYVFALWWISSAAALLQQIKVVILMTEDIHSGLDLEKSLLHKHFVCI